MNMNFGAQFLSSRVGNVGYIWFSLIFRQQDLENVHVNSDSFDLGEILAIDIKYRFINIPIFPVKGII